MNLPTARRPDSTDLSRALGLVSTCGVQNAARIVGIEKGALQEAVTSLSVRRPASAHVPAAALDAAFRRGMKAGVEIGKRQGAAEGRLEGFAEAVEAGPPPRWARLAQIIAEVAHAHGLTPADLKGESQVRAVSWPRQEAYWRLHHEGGLSYPRAGAILGGRDHTTALYGAQRHAQRMAWADFLIWAGRGA